MSITCICERNAGDQMKRCAAGERIVTEGMAQMRIRGIYLVDQQDHDRLGHDQKVLLPREGQNCEKKTTELGKWHVNDTKGLS